MLKNFKSILVNLEEKREMLKVKSNEPLLKERLSTIDLLVLTSLYQLETSFTFFTKQATSIRRSTVLCLPVQLVFPAKAEYHPDEMTTKNKHNRNTILGNFVNTHHGQCYKTFESRNLQMFVIS